MLWYLAAVASRVGIALSDVFAQAADKQLADDRALTLAALQPDLMPRRDEPTAAFEHTLLKLAGEVGLLVIDHEGRRIEQEHVLSAALLVAVARTLIQAADE